MIIAEAGIMIINLKYPALCNHIDCKRILKTGDKVIFYPTSKMVYCYKHSFKSKNKAEVRQ
jgi:hypothetical protein